MNRIDISIITCFVSFEFHQEGSFNVHPKVLKQSHAQIAMKV